jgi:hypothetical protein
LSLLPWQLRVSMSGSSVIVALNARLLRRMELDRDERNTAMRRPAFPSPSPRVPLDHAPDRISF